MDSTDTKLHELLEDLDEHKQDPPARQRQAPPPQSSVRLNPDRCVGCAACMRVCPTEAIRIRKEKALIKPHLCIDCGECDRVCPVDIPLRLLNVKMIDEVQEAYGYTAGSDPETSPPLVTFRVDDADEDIR